MSLIKSDAVVTKVTTATLKVEDIRNLIAADLGADPSKVKLEFSCSGGDDGYGGYTRPDFYSVKVTVTDVVV